MKLVPMVERSRPARSTARSDSLELTAWQATRTRLKRTSGSVRLATSLDARSNFAISRVTSGSVCFVAQKSSTMVSVSAVSRYVKGEYARTMASVRSMLASTTACSRCFASTMSSSSEDATAKYLDPPPAARPISVSIRGMVLIITTKWSRIEIIALAIVEADGKNLKPSPSTSIRTRRSGRWSTASEVSAASSGSRSEPSGRAAKASTKPTYALTDAESSPRSWLNMSADTTPSSGDAAACASCSDSYAVASALKISSTAGNHFFLSICTTRSQ
mmetsp:Transcript_2352/g.7731  ORF Transcript_2352/g.7731 Transcript_2352/m.7731 type:complete len:275 (+) Transcript_2352:991-1815(+)